MRLCQPSTLVRRGAAGGAQPSFSRIPKPPTSPRCERRGARADSRRPPLARNQPHHYRARCHDHDHDHRLPLRLSPDRQPGPPGATGVLGVASLPGRRWYPRKKHDPASGPRAPMLGCGIGSCTSCFSSCAGRAASSIKSLWVREFAPSSATRATRPPSSSPSSYAGSHRLYLRPVADRRYADLPGSLRLAYDA